jgi:hypothetical protein
VLVVKEKTYTAVIVFLLHPFLKIWHHCRLFYKYFFKLIDL